MPTMHRSTLRKPGRPSPPVTPPTGLPSVKSARERRSAVTLDRLQTIENVRSRPPLRRTLERRVASWGGFVDIIQGWKGFRNWCFRGQAKASWRLRPSLSRYVEVSRVCKPAWPLQEERIRRIFERKLHLFLHTTEDRDELEWLALMQHHGAPTRLLDFTWSPYVAAFFALEQATEDAAIWAVNLPLLWHIHSAQKVGNVRVAGINPRDRASFRTHFLSNRHAFVWQGDPFRMPQRVVAQSGTFLVPSHLGMAVEEILERYPGHGELLVKFVLSTAEMRAEAMASLYSMNITQATLFPGLDGLARSMAYEFEYSWQVDLKTNAPLLAGGPYLPQGVLG